MSWIPLFYGAVAVVTFIMGVSNAVRAQRSEKAFAVGTLLLPIGFALWAYGYGPDFAHTNFTALRIGSVSGLIGFIMIVLLTIRRGRTPK